MKLISKHKNWNEFYCEVTSALDEIAGIKPASDLCVWRHYIVIDELSIKDKCLAIRVPGGTVGDIFVDNNFTITKIVINPHYVVKTYPVDINEQIKQFVGTKIDGILAEENCIAIPLPK